MLNIGDPAPDFELESDSGEIISLAGLLSTGPAIIYFYPADFTPG